MDMELYQMTFQWIILLGLMACTPVWCIWALFDHRNRVLEECRLHSLFLEEQSKK